MRKKELKEQLDRIEEKNNQRWRILKDYLGVEEQEYAELREKIHMNIPFYHLAGFDGRKEPVKKTKLVKKRKK